MQPNTVGQPVVLTGYISFHGPGAAIGTLTEDTSPRCPGLSEKFSDIKNSATEFFVSVKHAVNHAVHKFGDWINKVSVTPAEAEKASVVNNAPASAAQIMTECAKEYLPVHLNNLSMALATQVPLTTNELTALSSGPLRGLVTQLQSLTMIDIPGMEDINLKAAALLSAQIGFGSHAAEKFSQLATISSADRVLLYREDTGFDMQFRTRVNAVIEQVTKEIIPELMKK
ncbi:hypothetical protein L9H26_06760 [Morganella psychrotolerans]|uniref:Virulence factor YopE GAP domain-containing protein n=1 Tax=Morganella psychrotolerans TaxID=368603 RepID=A0A5M9R8B1_9GAMM|nr:hypothetical protein [Morganella psychrotolerans]KAA8716970.1 hypothetical protein F4V73_03600 [Morganella psychrotolerans]OBU08701.1 hypothetical protein AYY16_05430 [Morganella psychrotolerans]